MAVRRLSVEEPHRLPLQRQFLLFPRHRTGPRQHGGRSGHTVIGGAYLDAVPHRRSVFNALSCWRGAYFFFAPVQFKESEFSLVTEIMRAGRRFV